jgi:hypothetical protein
MRRSHGESARSRSPGANGATRAPPPRLQWPVSPTEIPSGDLTATLRRETPPRPTRGRAGADRCARAREIRAAREALEATRAITARSKARMARPHGSVDALAVYHRALLRSRCRSIRTTLESTPSMHARPGVRCSDPRLPVCEPCRPKSGLLARGFALPGSLAACPGSLAACPGSLTACPGSLTALPGSRTACPGSRIRAPRLAHRVPRLRNRDPHGDLGVRAGD